MGNSKSYIHQRHTLSFCYFESLHVLTAVKSNSAPACNFVAKCVLFTLALTLTNNFTMMLFLIQIMSFCCIIQMENPRTSAKEQSQRPDCQDEKAHSAQPWGYVKAENFMLPLSCKVFYLSIEQYFECYCNSIMCYWG